MLRQPITIVGGLAVLARLRTAYRVTTDIDTVNRREDGMPSQLDVLVREGAKPVDAAGATLSTPAGEVRVDVLEIAGSQLQDLPTDPTDRLYVLAHDWARETATSLRIHARQDAGTSPVCVTALVSEPGPLVATKLQALPNRSRAKESTDLLDIARLVLDERAGPVVRDQLAEAASQLRADAALHVERWFHTAIDRSTRLVNSLPDGRDIDRTAVELVGDLLLTSLHGQGMPVSRGGRPPRRG